jgi:hypothetical protein
MTLSVCECCSQHGRRDCRLKELHELGRQVLGQCHNMHSFAEFHFPLVNYCVVYSINLGPPGKFSYINTV